MKKSMFLMISLLLLTISFATAETINIDREIIGLYNSYGSYYSFSFDTQDDILTGVAYVGAFPSGSVQAIRSPYINGSSTGLANVNIGDYREGLTYVDSLNNWYGLTFGGGVARLSKELNSTIGSWGTFTGAIDITNDNQYIYLLYTDKTIKKYDFSMNLIGTIGSTDLPINTLSEIDYVDLNKAFLIRHYGDFRIYDSNFNQYGNNHTLTGIDSQTGGLENNGTHILVSGTDLPKSMYFLPIETLLPEANITTTQPIFKQAPDIPLSNVAGLPFSHAQDDTYQYILSDTVLIDNVTPAQVINRFDNNFNYVDGLCADISNNWAFIGKHEDNLLMRSNDNDIHQLKEDCSPVHTQYLSGVTNAGDLKVIDGQVYVISNEGRIIVYSIATNPDDIISYIYQYEFSISDEITASQSYLTGYGNYLYILDSPTRKIFRYDTSGGFLEAFEIISWNYTSDPKDLFFYNDNLYIIAYEEALAVRYSLTQEEFVDYDLLGGVKYSKTNFCVNDILLCDDTSHYIQPNGEVVSICDGTLTECPIEANAGGCNNVLNNDSVLTGSCGAISCSNECLQTGRIDCNSLTTYTLCGNYDADVCLETGSTLYCPIGQICVQGNDGLTGCEASPVLPNLLQGLTVSKNIQATNAYSINVDSERYYINSIFTTAWIEFNALTTPTQASYSTSIVDYQEIVMKSQYMTDENEWIGDGTVSAIATDGDGRLHKELDGGPDDEWVYSNLPATTGNLIFNHKFAQKENDKDKDSQLFATLFDSNGTIIHEMYFENDKDLLEFYIYESNNEVIGDLLLTDIGTANNIYEISVDYHYNEQVDSLSIQINIFREVNNEIIVNRYFTQPLAFTNPNAGRPAQIYYHAEKDKWDLYGYELVQVPDYNQYTAQDLNNDLHERFEFDSVGCRNVRLFANEYPIPTYFFYDEFEICVVEVGEQVDEQLSGQLDGISDEETCFLGFCSEGLSLKIAVIILALTIGATLWISSETETQTGKTGMFIAGFVIFGLELLFFITQGIIEGWYIALLIIIGLVLLAFMMLKNRRGV